MSEIDVLALQRLIGYTPYLSRLLIGYTPYLSRLLIGYTPYLSN